MRASCQGRSLRGGADLSATPPPASPSSRPAVTPTPNNKIWRDFVVIRRQHTCGGDSPPAAESRRFPYRVIEKPRGRGKARVQRQVVNDIVQRQGFTDEKALAKVDAELCGARTDRVGLDVPGDRVQAKDVGKLGNGQDHGLRFG